jgi:hypothetical protein
MDQQQYQQTGFWQPHDDRKDASDDFTLGCRHDYHTWAGNPYVQKCSKCGDWYRTDVPGRD